jgi:hypothetical protein
MRGGAFILARHRGISPDLVANGHQRSMVMRPARADGRRRGILPYPPTRVSEHNVQS